MFRSYLYNNNCEIIKVRKKDRNVISCDIVQRLQMYRDYVELGLQENTLESIVAYLAIPDIKYVDSKNIFEKLYCSRNFNKAINDSVFPNLDGCFYINNKYALSCYDIFECAISKIIDKIMEKYKNIKKLYNERIVGLYLWDQENIKNNIDTGDVSVRFINDYRSIYLYQYGCMSKKYKDTLKKKLSRELKKTGDIINRYSADTDRKNNLRIEFDKK